MQDSSRRDVQEGEAVTPKPRRVDKKSCTVKHDLCQGLAARGGSHAQQPGNPPKVVAPREGVKGGKAVQNLYSLVSVRDVINGQGL
eukprot:scaffold194152_cov23-Tisochrysis_lutea.AAC.1